MVDLGWASPLAIHSPYDGAEPRRMVQSPQYVPIRAFFVQTPKAGHSRQIDPEAIRYKRLFLRPLFIPAKGKDLSMRTGVAVGLLIVFETVPCGTDGPSAWPCPASPPAVLFDAMQPRVCRRNIRRRPGSSAPLTPLTSSASCTIAVRRAVALASSTTSEAVTYMLVTPSSVATGETMAWAL